MAFFRGPQSPREEQYASNPLSPPQRNPNPNRWSASMAGAADVRGALQRRFTTNTVPTLSPIGQQRRQAAGDVQVVSRSASMSDESGEQAGRQADKTSVEADGVLEVSASEQGGNILSWATISSWLRARLMRAAAVPTQPSPR
jgi:hypothetical protein